MDKKLDRVVIIRDIVEEIDFLTRLYHNAFEQRLEAGETPEGAVDPKTIDYGSNALQELKSRILSDETWDDGEVSEEELDWLTDEMIDNIYADAAAELAFADDDD